MLGFSISPTVVGAQAGLTLDRSEAQRGLAAQVVLMPR